MQDDNWVMVYSTDKEHQAELTKQVLVDNGIEAHVLNKRDSAYKAFGDIEVLVKDTFVIKAKKVINDFFNQ